MQGRTGGTVLSWGPYTLGSSFSIHTPVTFLEVGHVLQEKQMLKSHRECGGGRPGLPVPSSTFSTSRTLVLTQSLKMYREPLMDLVLLVDFLLPGTLKDTGK